MAHSPPGLGARMSAIASSLSPYPPSFDGNGWLYFVSLVSLMCITMFSIVTFCWMGRHIWRDRFEDHPLSLAFMFRIMVMGATGVGIIRCLPDVVYMTCYGEVTGDTMGNVLAVKRVADTLALPGVIFWMTILVLIYPFVMIALKAPRARHTSFVDPFSVWPRLARPFVIFATILVIASLMAVTKGAMGHHG